MKQAMVALATLVLLAWGPGALASAADFVHRDGDRLVMGGKGIILKGVCFGNGVWGNPSTAPTNHHDERDYKRLKDMNANAVRFYMNYGLFEDDAKPYAYKESGFAWLDRNIAWAKKHGIYLILNMHVPQGGFQSNGDGMGLWTNPENRRRLASLWKAIAQRYRNEPVIAGYDLVNEPVVPDHPSQWENLAKDLVRTVRGVDPNHLIIVERTNAAKAIGESWSGLNLFLVDDPNVMYTFHFYLPFEYSHQNTSWTGRGEGGKYPDPDVLTVPSDLTWYKTSGSSKTVRKGDSDWTYLEGRKFKATDSKMLVGKPALVSARNQGTVYFDDIVIQEYDAEGKPLKTLFTVNPDSMSDWYGWSQDGKGTFTLSTTVGHGDNTSFAISGTTSDANLTGNACRFRVTKGHSYSISGWVKGQGVTSGDCMLRLDFETSPSGGKVTGRDKAYLEANLLRYIEWGRQNNVPLYVGEWGLYKDCFTDGKGGLAWLADMLDLLNGYGVGYTYHAYHEDAFGIFKNTGLPTEDRAIPGFIGLFRSGLKAK